MIQTTLAFIRENNLIDLGGCSSKAMKEIFETIV